MCAPPDWKLVCKKIAYFTELSKIRLKSSENSFDNPLWVYYFQDVRVLCAEKMKADGHGTSKLSVEMFLTNFKKVL